MASSEASTTASAGFVSYKMFHDNTLFKKWGTKFAMFCVGPSASIISGHEYLSSSSSRRRVSDRSNLSSSYSFKFSHHLLGTYLSNLKFQRKWGIDRILIWLLVKATECCGGSTLSSVEATGSSLVFPSAASTGTAASVLATSLTWFYHFVMYDLRFMSTVNNSYPHSHLKILLQSQLLPTQPSHMAQFLVLAIAFTYSSFFSINFNKWSPLEHFFSFYLLSLFLQLSQGLLQLVLLFL